MSAKKISVIIPIYNTELYIEQCLNSVITQDLKEIEILCIDDGSTDSSLSILNKYKELDSRILVFNQKNQGAGIARNLGIQHATGEFIAFMDADDFYPELDILSTLYNNAKIHNVSVAGGSLYYFKNDERIATSPKEKFTFEEDKIYSYADYQYDYGYSRFIYLTTLLKENKIYFPSYKRFEDPCFFIKAMNTAKTFHATTKETYRYRISMGQREWSQEMVLGLLNGLKHSLELSSALKLSELHMRLVNRFIERTKNIIMPFILKLDLNVQNQYLVAFNAVDKQYKFSQDNLLLQTVLSIAQLNIENNNKIFPNKIQRMLLFLYSPFIKLLAKEKYYKQFKQNPSQFFHNTKNPANKIFFNLLNYFKKI